MLSKIEDEIGAPFDFIEHVCGFFGFEFRLELSTRPDNYLGTIEAWDEAGATSPIPASLFGLVSRIAHSPSDSPKPSTNIIPANANSTQAMGPYPVPQSTP
ncbi:hypothetical protein JAAARDRAFT_62854 [Jaapia argillacea MUCL 33604]|uniref:Uncharacterized protein n=1 Tax=Jaapia argillacea MUCL 33604 TaxID=933084 RepID=A0A067P898_9AGAM|nr:hypothetical protein JAAARDRAFT_62854 [Jaapia argillacea MUCL 33604]